MEEKRETLLERQGRALKLLGIYTGVILLIFAIFIPFLGPESVMGTGEVTQPSATPKQPSDSAIVPVSASEKKVDSAPVPVSQHTAPPPPATVKALIPDLSKIRWPLKGQVIQQYGITYSRTFSDYRFHNGIDIQAKIGSDITSVLPGSVIKIETTKSGLTTVVIEHGVGWQSSYSQLEDSSLKVGAAVKTGQIIGSVGQPGLSEVLDGPHLHFSLLKDGKEVNPLDYLPGQ